MLHNRFHPEASLFALPFEVTFYLVGFLGMLVFGISKGGFAGSFGIVSLPILSAVMPVDQAVAVMLPVLCAMDLIGLRMYRKDFDGKNVVMLLPPSLVGIFLGWLAFSVIEKSLVTMGIGLLALAFNLMGILRLSSAKSPRKAFRHGFWKAGFCGILLGLGSTVANAGGIPSQIYMLPQNMDKIRFVATATILFAVVNYAKLIPFWQLGLLDSDNLLFSLSLLPAAPLGLYLGRYLLKKVNQAWFSKFCHLMLFVTGVKLFFDGLQAHLN